MSFPTPRILLVEDNPANQQILLFILKRLGYQADVAPNGQEGLDAVHRQTYDIVLMDLQMPVMDGLEATRRLRTDFPPERQPYIIAVTANVVNGDRQWCLDAGMDDYLAKPVPPGAMQEAIARAVATRGQASHPAPDRAPRSSHPAASCSQRGPGLPNR